MFFAILVATRLGLPARLGQIGMAKYIVKELHLDRDSTFVRSVFSNSGAFWFTSLSLVLAMGIQLFLLRVEASVAMLDNTTWSFGQIMVVTHWFPSLGQYIYHQLRMPPIP